MSENPVQIAIRMEVDGMAFYQKAADNTKNPLGKKMFLSFVEDEKKHLKALEDVFKGVDDTNFFALFQEEGPRKRIETVFSRAEEEVSGDALKAGSGELAALETAMKMEQDGYAFYMDIAEKSDDAAVRELFKLLAIEEDEHYNMLMNTHAYLSDTGNWFMWGEEGVVDGG